jgi:hypothetical protein
MRVENSPKYEAAMRARIKALDAESKDKARSLKHERERWHVAGCPWMPMRKCPFAALDNEYGIDGAILVSDGKAVAVATISRRFGGEEDPRPDLPGWWWDWEVNDELASETWAYGEPAGQPEVEFIPTVWTFLPMPPRAELADNIS